MRHRAQAVVALERPASALGQPHVVELADGPGRQAVTAGLLAGEALLVDDEHPVALLREPVGRRRTGRPATDDERRRGARSISARRR